MRVKIKFLAPVSQEKLIHNLVNAKKRNPHYKHHLHKLIQEAKDKVSFQVFGESNKNLVYCDIDFYPEENLVDIECEASNYDQLHSLLVFDLLESIDEKAVIRFIDSKIFFNGGMEFYFVSNGPRQEIHRVSSDRNNLLEVTNSRTVVQIRQILEEVSQFDFI